MWKFYIDPFDCVAPFGSCRLTDRILISKDPHLIECLYFRNRIEPFHTNKMLGYRLIASDIDAIKAFNHIGHRAGSGCLGKGLLFLHEPAVPFHMPVRITVEPRNHS